MKTAKQNLNSKVDNRVKKQYVKECVQAVPSNIRKGLTAAQAITLGWFIQKYNWDKEEEIRYTKELIAEDTGMKESTVISTLKTLVTKKMIEKTFVGKRNTPSRVRFIGEMARESQHEEIKQSESVIETRSLPKVNDEMFQVILKELQAIRKENQELKEEISTLRKDNDIMKEGMRIINGNLKKLGNNTHNSTGYTPIIEEYPSKVDSPIPTPKKPSEAKLEANVEVIPTAEQATPTRTPIESPVIASNPQHKETYSRAEENATEVKLEASANVDRRKAEIDTMTLTQLYAERTRYWFKHNATDPYVEKRIEEEENKKKGIIKQETPKEDVVESPLTQEIAVTSSNANDTKGKRNDFMHNLLKGLRTPKNPIDEPKEETKKDSFFVKRAIEILKDDSECEKSPRIEEKHSMNDSLTPSIENPSKCEIKPNTQLQEMTVCQLMTLKFERMNKGESYNDIDEELLRKHEEMIKRMETKEKQEEPKESIKPNAIEIRANAIYKMTLEELFEERDRLSQEGKEDELLEERIDILRKTEEMNGKAPEPIEDSYGLPF